MATEISLVSEESDASEDTIEPTSSATPGRRPRKRKIEGVLDPLNPGNHERPTENWRERAACRNHDQITLDDFFEVSITRKNTPKIVALQRLCGSCPVAAECLYESLMFNYEGYWAGLSRKQRIAYIRMERDSSVVDLTVEECAAILDELRSDAVSVPVRTYTRRTA